jgi:hypothetical protein
METIRIESTVSLAPSPAWNELRIRMHRVWVDLAHAGIDPQFRRAVRNLYFRDIRNQMEVIDYFESETKRLSLRATWTLLRKVSDKRLVKFTEYHAHALNDSHSELLQEIYTRVYAIRAFRKEIIRTFIFRQVPSEMTDCTDAISEVASFRLLRVLGQEGLKPSLPIELD